MALDTGYWHPCLLDIVAYSNERSAWEQLEPLCGSGRRSVPDWVTMQSARLYTQISARRRRSGRDAGTQAQGGDASYYSSTGRAAKLPSMALDTGIHAGMTTLKHTCV